MSPIRMQLYRDSFVRSCLANAPESAIDWLVGLDEIVGDAVEPTARMIDQESGHPGAALEALGAFGVLGVQIPRKFGGLGYGNGVAAVVVERVAQTCASTAALLMFHFQVVNRTLHFGHSERRRDDLVAMAAGEMIAASAWTEPIGGKDKAAAQTRLTESAAGWVVDGEKTFCTGLRSATVVDVLVTADLSGESGPTFVRVDAKNPGVVVGEIYPMLGLRGTSTGSLELSSVQVREVDVVGRVGAGRDLMRANHQTPLNPGLLALGVSAAAYEAAVCVYSGQVPGAPSRAHSETARRALADALLRVEASYTFAADVVARMATAQASAYVLASKLKVYATTTAEEVTRQLMHGAGSRGFLAHLPLERHFRDAQATSLMGPTNDLCLERVAADTLTIDDPTGGKAL